MATETNSTGETRRYRKRRRAELEAETRRRITEAAVKLHETIGPARTTVSGLAREAGVQRATVYRHFPTEEDLFAACSAHFESLNPAPESQAWLAVRDPDERLRHALAELYEWYAWAEPMLVNTTRDGALVPAMSAARERFAHRFEAYTEALLRGRRERGRRRARVAAAIALALAFQTWRSLVSERGLDDPEAIELMAGAVAAAGSAS